MNAPAEPVGPVQSRLAAPFRASLITVVASLIFSLGALTNRWADQVDAWQYLLWRSIGVLVALELVERFRKRQSPLVRAWTSGPTMVGASFGLFGASLGFVYALKNTTAANASFFSSLTPFVAAALGWVVLKERFGLATWLAMALAGCGLALMLFGPTGQAQQGIAQQGSGIASSFRGNMSGLVCSVGFALYMICVRTDSTRDWGSAMSGYCTMMVVVCAAVTFSKGRPLVPVASNIGLALLHGALLIVAGTLLFNHGAKLVPAVALAVFAQAETLAVPLMIMMVFGEIPSAAALLGGAMILIGVLVQAIGEARHSRAAGVIAASPIPG
jgi:drug/metabolite transporter, DME family